MIQLKVKRNTYTLTPRNEKKIKDILLNDYPPETPVTVFIDKKEDEICKLSDIFER